MLYLGSVEVPTHWFVEIIKFSRFTITYIIFLNRGTWYSLFYTISRLYYNRYLGMCEFLDIFADLAFTSNTV